MFYKYILSITIILVSLSSIAQSARKGYKSMEKGEFDKSAEAFEKILTSNSSHPAANLGMAILLSHDKNPKKDYVQSWVYIRMIKESKKAFSNDNLDAIGEYLHSTEKVKSNKPIKEKVDNTIADIENKLIKYIREEHDLKAIYKILKEYPTFPYYDNIAHIRNQFEFYKARKKNTLEAYSTFIKQFPKAAQVEKAKVERNKLAFKIAKNTNTEESYNLFIKECPSSGYIKRAKELRDSLAYVKVVQTNTLEKYEYFVSNYPKAKQTVEARKKLYSLLYEKTKTSTDINIYNKFIRLYPESKDFSSVYSRKADVLAKKHLQSLSVPSSSVKWAKAFDFNNQKDEAQAMTISAQNELIIGGTTTSSSKESSLWLVKLNSAGEMVWESTIPRKAPALIHSIHLNAKNETVIVGYKKGTKEAWVMRLSKEGKKLIEKKLGSMEITATAVSEKGKIYIATKEPSNQLTLKQFDENGFFTFQRDYAQKGYFSNISIKSNQTLLTGGKWIVNTDSKLYIDWEDTLKAPATFAELSVNSKTISSISRNKSTLYYNQYYISGTLKNSAKIDSDIKGKIYDITHADGKGTIIVAGDATGSAIYKIDESGANLSKKQFPNILKPIAVCTNNMGQISYLVGGEDYFIITLQDFESIGK